MKFKITKEELRNLRLKDLERSNRKKKWKGLNLFKSSKFKIIKRQKLQPRKSIKVLDIKVILKSQLHFYILTANN